jgi:general secretion pathway protein L
MQLSLGQPTFPALGSVARRLVRWWWREFVSLWPERLIALLSSQERPLLVIRPGLPHVSFELIGFPRSPAASEAAVTADIPAEIHRFLSSRGLRQADVDIGLRLSGECLFSRHLLLPLQARDAVDRIVRQDLATKTPFKADDIYHDHLISERPDGERIEVWQWIVRREFVQRAMSSLALSLEVPTFVLFEDRGAPHPAAIIDLNPTTRSGPAWHRHTGSILCLAVVLLTLIAGGLKYWSQQTALDRLDAEIATANSKAQRVRTLIDQLNAQKRALIDLRLRKSQAPGLLDLWEETTRLLPQDTWLTEFRLAEDGGAGGQQVTLIGFSGAAPRLVGIIDGSALFHDAALISPIAFDATEGRERFAMQAKLRAPASAKDTKR